LGNDNSLALAYYQSSIDILIDIDNILEGGNIKTPRQIAREARRKYWWHSKAEMEEKAVEKAEEEAEGGGNSGSKEEEEQEQKSSRGNYDPSVA